MGLQTQYSMYREIAAVMSIVAVMNRSRVAMVMQVQTQVGRCYRGGSEVQGVWDWGVRV